MWGGDCPSGWGQLSPVGGCWGGNEPREECGQVGDRESRPCARVMGGSSVLGLQAELATCPCPRRATAKDCLESSYFKEKPLRK